MNKRISRMQQRYSPALICGLILLTSLVPTFAFAAADRPNVILITIDTLRADRLEAYGYAQAQTPTITQLAREGVLFENTIVQTPITLPSHASIFTGTYPFYHGVQDVVGRLDEGIPMLSEWFKENGYTTGAFIGSSVLIAQWGLARGFDVYEDSFPTNLARQVDFSRIERPADQVITLASEWIQATRSKPFFLWVHLYDPHDPYKPPEPFASDFKDRPYDGEIAFVDQQLGRLFDALKKDQLYENSLIVFTSDHGESLGEHEEEYHAYYIYDASLRVPLIFKIPPPLTRGLFEPGVRVANQVRSIDIAPTIIQLLRGEVPSWIQGEGLVAMMAGKRPDVHLPAYAETHYPRIHFNWSPLFSYSTPTHKFIEAPIPELYDLKEDPRELNNIFGQQTALAHQLRERMHELQKRYATRTPGAGGAEEIDAETIERLKALGYVAFSAGGSAAAAGGNYPDPKEKIGTYNQLNRAISLSREGKRKLAIQTLLQVAREEPEMPIVHFLLGTEYLHVGMYLKAIEEFSTTIVHNPGSNVARFNLARAYSFSGLSEKAEQTLKELLELDPHHFGARHLLATILAKTGRFLEAVREELRVLEIRPSLVDGHNNLGSYYLNLDRLDEAVQSYLEALRYDPGNIMARTNLALAYLRQERYDEALEQAQKTTELAPRLGLGHYYLGLSYRAKGMEAEAGRAFRKAKELDPSLNVPKS